MTDAPKTYSIALRLRRTIYEDAYVSVPVTGAIITQGPDGKGSIDFERLVAEGVRIGADPRVQWAVESTTVSSHPIQAPRPPDRLGFDAFYEDGKPKA